MIQTDVKRWKEEVIQEGCVGLSWTDPSLMKSQRGTDKEWYRADNACCQTDEHRHTPIHTDRQYEKKQEVQQKVH